MTPAAPAFDALARAVRKNDVADAARILAGSPDVRTRLNDPMPDGPFGATLLLAAVHHDNRDMAELLLEAGADINQRSHWWAGSFGVLDHEGSLADFLIGRGAVVDAHAAARLRMIDRLDALIAADPGVVHARGGDGQTPLHFAGSIPVAEFLLARGADINARDVDHESTPAQWMLRDRQPVARYLVGCGCQTDLLMVAALGDVARVRSYLDADPASIRMSVSETWFPKKDPRSGGTIYNWTLGTGKTAHTIAHEFGHPDVLQLLMDRSPNELRLAVACELGDEAAVRDLTGRQPDIAQTLGDDELRKLPDAARDENVAGVRLMLAAGWPVSARGQHGGTALHWAGWHGNTEMIRTLLQHNAPLELTDHDFAGTPLFWTIYASIHGWRCATGDYAAAVEILLDASATRPKITHELEMSDAVRQVLVRRGLL